MHTQLLQPFIKICAVCVSIFLQIFLLGVAGVDWNNCRRTRCARPALSATCPTDTARRIRFLMAERASFFFISRSRGSQKSACIRQTVPTVRRIDLCARRDSLSRSKGSEQLEKYQKEEAAAAAGVLERRSARSCGQEREKERNRFSERRSQGQFNYTRRVFGSQVLAFCNNHQHTHSVAFAPRLGVEEKRERDWERDKKFKWTWIKCPVMSNY
jgi:hypothetical protein